MLLQPFSGSQLAIIEKLRCVGAYVGMQPPRFFKKQTLFGSDGLLAGENVVERRGFSSVRVAALCGLIELLRVPDQDDGPCSLGNRQHIGQ